MDVRRALAGSYLPHADAEVLLGAVLQKDRSWLLAHADDHLTDEQWSAFTTMVERRRTYEPIAYIIGAQEFYGRKFLVDSRVLIPRPSTEGLVRTALSFIVDGKDRMDDVDSQVVAIARARKEWKKPRLIADIGTGSGCVAVTLALEVPNVRIIATDVSKDALDVAKENARRLGVENRIEFRQGSGTDPIEDIDEPFVIVSNPPYIPKNRILMKDVIEYEPHVALFGGDDGAMLIREIVSFATQHPFCVGCVLECEEAQAKFVDMW